MRYFIKKTIPLLGSCALLLSASSIVSAAETVCNDNGGTGWPFAVSSTTNINIPFMFGDVSEAFDVNVFTDITKLYPGDLTARVTSPQGTTVWLFERPGTALDESTPSAPWGCNENDIVVTFDDEAAVGTNIENVCGGGVPSIGGTFEPHNPDTPLLPPDNNLLSAIDGEDPSGNWAFELVHVAPFDPGNLNNVCITAAFAAVTFDKWVSTNNTCSDTLDTLSVATGDDVYYCYTVSNPSTETFTINLGDAFDDQGHDISALETSYPQNASQTVVIGPISAGSAALPDNITTVNNAQVTANFATANYTGTMVTTETASLTVIVNPPLPPASGVKQLYFGPVNTVSPDLTRVPPGLTDTGNIDTLVLSQGLPFVAPFTINGGTITNVQLRLRRRSGGGSRNIEVQLLNGATGVVIGTGTVSTLNNNNWQTRTAAINITSDANFAIGDFIRVIVNNVPASNGNIEISSFRNGDRSEVQMQSDTVINIGSISIFSAPFPATSQLSSYAAGSMIYIRATVSDPFGNADITSADITITDSATVVRLPATAMSEVDTPNSATKVFEYAYLIPATPNGLWDIDIIATEGVDAIPVTHNAQATMIIGIPTVTISKNSTVLSDPINASSPKAIPGAIVEYAVNVSNTGFGYMNSDSFVITDPLNTSITFFFGSPVTPITFIDGTTTSGLVFSFTSLGSTTDDVDFSNDGGSSFITPTVDANGFDTTAPPINFIRINPKGGFRGSDGINNPSVQINFRVRVE